MKLITSLFCPFSALIATQCLVCFLYSFFLVSVADPGEGGGGGGGGEVGGVGGVAAPCND